MTADLTGWPPILFLDLDGTVRWGKTELGRFVNTPADVHVFPEAVTRMRVWRAEHPGGRIIGVTNQAGIGLGHIPPDVAVEIETETKRQAKWLFDMIFTCPHAPSAACFCRKPQPGLLVRGVLWVSTMAITEFVPSRTNSLMVGDRPEDEAAAGAAGVEFLDAATWRAG